MSAVVQPASLDTHVWDANFGASSRFPNSNLPICCGALAGASFKIRVTKLRVQKRAPHCKSR